MTHIMVPDGTLPFWLWGGGWLLAAALLGAALWTTRASDRARLIPLAGALAAVMALIMSLEIVPLGYEPHLTVLTGIVLGPAYGLLATFIFNLLRMLLGDGGVTVLGLNTLVLGAETVAGYYVFRALARWLPGETPPGRVGLAAGIATVVALALATLLFLALIALGQIDVTAVAEEGLLERIGTDAPGFGLFAGAVLALGAVGWIIEGVFVGALVGFVRAVRPVLLREALAR